MHPILSFSLKIALACLFLYLISCKNRCGETPAQFWNNYKQFVDQIRAEPKDIEHHVWESYDKEYKVFYSQCYPKYYQELSSSQQDSFWMLGFAYVCSRYQLELIKKFRKTDYTINLIKDSLAGRNMDIFVCMDSLQTNWPAFQALGAKERDRLERYFRRERRDTLLPSYPTDSLQ